MSKLNGPFLGAKLFSKCVCVCIYPLLTGSLFVSLYSISIIMTVCIIIYIMIQTEACVVHSSFILVPPHLSLIGEWQPTTCTWRQWVWPPSVWCSHWAYYSLTDQLTQNPAQSSQLSTLHHSLFILSQHVEKIFLINANITSYTQN